MAHSATAIANQARFLRAKNQKRNKYHEDILALHEGRWDDVYPGLLPAEFDRAFVANMIPIAAEDTAQVLGALPRFSCSSASATSERARAFAAKRTKIVNYAVECSNLKAQAFRLAHMMVSYGFGALSTQPDFEQKMTKIRVEDTYRSYYQLDDYQDETLIFCRIYRQSIDELARLYPEHSAALGNLRKDKYGQIGPDRPIEVVRWFDKHVQALVTLEGDILLDSIENPLSRCPIRVVEMPRLGDVARGQYDDAIGVQGARALAQAYLLQGMEESVNAPIAAPDDVQSMPFGPKSLIRSATPQAIRRVELPIQGGLFGELQNLDRELSIATRHNDARSGNIDASIITGQGVEALQGMFNTQIRTAQAMLTIGYQAILELWMESEQHYFGNVAKTVSGNRNGARYDLTYTPNRDIADDFSVEVSYGASTGLDPNRQLIWVMQANAGKLISRTTAMSELPVDINVDEEQTLMDVEQMRDTLAASLAATAQAIPMMATNGMDPTDIVAKLAEITRQRQKGKPIEEVAAAVFAPPPPAPTAEGAAPAAEDPLAALMGGGGQAPAGEFAPPQDDLLMSLATLTPGGNANLQSAVSRRQNI